MGTPVRTLSSLEDAVYGRITRLPLPVASPLRAAQIAGSRAGAVKHLLQASEALITLLGAIALMDAAAEGQPLKALNEQGAQRPTLGTWRTLLEGLGGKPSQPTVPALKGQVRRGHGRAAITTLVDLRNRHAHEPHDVFMAQANTHHRTLLTALDDLLTAADWLSHHVLLRVEGTDELTRELKVRPLVGHDPKRSAVRLTWPGAPAGGQVVLLEVAAPSRWLALSPVYRWADEHLVVYGRTVDGEVHWQAGDGTGYAARTSQADPLWLLNFLTAAPVKRGQAALSSAARARLMQMDRTQLYESSGRIELPLDEAPLTAPRRARAGLWLGLAIGVLAVAAWALRGPLGLSWPAADKPAAEIAPGASAPSAAPAAGAGGVERIVSDSLPPEALLQASTAAYNAQDLFGQQSLFYDPIECYYGATDGYPRHKRFRKITGSHRMVTRQVKVVARVGNEALLCERRAFVKRGERDDDPPSQVVYWGARAEAGRWRIFAEAGHHKDLTESRCVGWLQERFNLAEPLRTLGSTQCGEGPAPAEADAPKPAAVTPRPVGRPPVKRITAPTVIKGLPAEGLRLTTPGAFKRIAPAQDR